MGQKRSFQTKSRLPSQEVRIVTSNSTSLIIVPTLIIVIEQQ